MPNRRPPARRAFGAAVIAVVLALVVGLGGFLMARAATFTDQAPVTGNTFTTAPCFGGDTGFMDATATATDLGGDDDGFELNPTNAFADGGGFASNIDGAGDRQRYYNYGFSISSDCAIQGIEVRLDWWMDDILGTNSMDLELSWNGGTSWTTAKTDTQETTAEHSVVLGGSADTWGRSWSVAELSDVNFRVRVTSSSTSGFRDFYLDWVPVRIYYAPPP
jgi:hypothetical protein